jgi:serine/threonine protein phosphatase PrpC
MNFNAGNSQHIGARQQQQDSFGFSDPSDKAFVRHGGFLGIVADGMGGLTNGQEASLAAVRSFLAAYQAKTSTESVVDALSRSLLEANRAVLEIAKNGSSSEAGTTLVAAVVLNERVYWISAGDSRIYWLHNDQLTQLTADHVYAAKLNRDVVQGRLSLTEAQNHPERASLTSFLGRSDLAITDRNLRPLLLHKNDCILLCSDGFYRALSASEIAEAFRGNPQHACDSLVQLGLAKNRKQQDNLTIIALKATTNAPGLSNLSKQARLLLILSSCLLLLLATAGYWFVLRPLRDNKTLSAPQKQAQPSRPQIVSQPPAAGPPVSAKPSISLPAQPSPDPSAQKKTRTPRATGTRKARVIPTGGGASGTSQPAPATPPQPTTPAPTAPVPSVLPPPDNPSPPTTSPDQPPGFVTRKFEWSYLVTKRSSCGAITAITLLTRNKGDNLTCLS